MTRRSLLGLLLGALAGFASAQQGPRVVAIRAKKWEFMPAEVTLKAGEPVVLELTTEDVTMGFSQPALKLNAEIAPGKVARVAFTPEKPGRYDYVCDIFCGDGHEDMGGTLVVV